MTDRSELSLRRYMKDKLRSEGALGILALTIALSLCLFHVYTAQFGLLSAIHQRMIHLSGVLFLLFLRAWVKGRNRSERAVNAALFLATLVCSVFYYLKAAPDLSRIRGAHGATDDELLVAAVYILLVLEGTRRYVGLGMSLIAVGAIAYGFLGPYLPSVLHHRGYDAVQLLEWLGWTTEGLFGLPLSVSATFIALFVIFGHLLEYSGLGEFFVNLAGTVTKNVQGGPAQAAIVSSSLFGTISGVGAANVVTTGTFTIPAMKKIGYPAHFAGAVEAVASTGGQIMPPVMGAAAFVMAEMTGIPYGEVCLMAAIPAILYYVSCGLGVYAATGLMGIESRGQLGYNASQALDAFRRNWPFVIPVILLIYLLMVVRYTPTKAALYSMYAVLALLIVMPSRRLTWADFIRLMEKSANGLIVIATATASAGLVVGMVSITGIGLRFTHNVVAISGGQVLVLLLFTACACLVLGMGLPTSACYIITATLAAPALVKMGIPLQAAHLFSFYYAILSMVTPPVAQVAYVAAGVAEASPFSTALEATRLAAAGFLVPFMFVFQPVLVLAGDWSIGSLAFYFLKSACGLLFMNHALYGWAFRKLGLLERVLLGICACLSITPGIAGDILGLVFGGVILVVIWVSSRKKPISSLKEGV